MKTQEVTDYEPPYMLHCHFVRPLLRGVGNSNLALGQIALTTVLGWSVVAMLEKPFAVDELVSKVRGLLSEISPLPLRKPCEGVSWS